MKLRNLLLATASLALALGVAGAVVAQSNGPAPGGRTRHLLFIATPGGGGADDQSGIVRAGCRSRLPLRQAHSLWPAGRQDARPENLGHDRLHSGQQDLCHHRWRQHDRFDLKTDKIAWTFKGETAPVAITRRGSATERLLRAALYPAGRQDPAGRLRL